MKKDIFYRAFRGNMHPVFVQDRGYRYKLTRDGKTISFMIARCGSRSWDVTHEKSGQLAIVIPQTTRAGCIEVLNDPDYITAAFRIVEQEQTKTLTAKLEEWRNRTE